MFDRYFQLGYITGKHGLQGELKIQLDCDDPEYYIELESVFVNINQKLVPFFIEYLHLIPGNKAIMKLEEVESIEKAETLKGKELYLPEEFLPELEDGQFYYHQVVGYRAIDSVLGDFGSVIDVFTGGPQELFIIDSNGREVLIPLNDDFILKLDHDKKLIEFNLPTGLLDIYLNDDN